MEESGCLLKRRGIGLKVGRLGEVFKYPWEVGWLHTVERASRLRNSIDAFSALGVEYWLLSTNFGTQMWRLQFEIVVWLLPHEQ